ncbi:hypothetical protein CkaCkLH20_08593 [Colletotrichum karsti]|uniref:Uncharacterized protein n=1 Tax=Colletotrichum karsti TaxID=1095194 RepID=A0A9P6I057_9PEZI|nr:uncharacterized protein CkaCkLH20_08593 [Colletotrichum karsti]KAF9873859.1 hypothetical protein CkaCkLH20_08593 [Colletotrichum karsti]
MEDCLFIEMVCRLEWRAPFATLCIEIRSLVYQELDNFDIRMKRTASSLESASKVSSRRVDVCASVQQECDDLLVTKERCRLQRVSIFTTFEMDIRSVVKQELHDINKFMLLTTRRHEWAFNDPWWGLNICPFIEKQSNKGVVPAFACHHECIAHGSLACVDVCLQREEQFNYLEMTAAGGCHERVSVFPRPRVDTCVMLNEQADNIDMT